MINEVSLLESNEIETGRTSLITPGTSRAPVHDIESSLGNPRYILPRAVSSYSSSQYFVELIGRLLWFDTDNEKRFDQTVRSKTAAKYYKMAELAFPESRKISLLRMTHLIYLDPDLTKLTGMMDNIKERKPGVCIRFELFKRGI